jgi:hypothetical protein
VRAEEGSEVQVKIILLYTFCACIFAFADQAIAGEFFDDFEDEDETAENWEILFGEWQIGMRPEYPGWFGVNTSGDDANVPIALAKTPDGEGIYATDGVVVETEFVDSKGGFRYAVYVVISYVTEEEAYLAGGLIGSSQTWRVEKINPTPGIGWTEREELVATPMAGTDAGPRSGGEIFVLKVAVEGDDVVVYIDGKEGTRYTFPGGVPKGRIGLASVRNNGNYNWVRITGPGVMAVNCRSKLGTKWGSIKARSRKH